MEKKDNRLSFREAYKLNNRAFKMVSKKYPGMISSRIICVIWSAITPYITIYLSALIVGELAGARDAERLKKLVLATLGAEVLFAFVGALLTRWRK